MDDKRLEAAKRGESRYMGTACRTCGNSERFTSNGNCVACTQAYTRRKREQVKALMAQAKEAHDVA